MKRILGFVAAVLLLASTARAQITPYNFRNILYLNGTNLCTALTLQTPPPAGSGMALCVDNTGAYPWTGTAFTAPSSTIGKLTINTGITASSGGYNAFSISSPVCTTTGAGGSCAEPTHTFSPTGFVDTNYFIDCTCTSVGTGVPAVQSVTKASNAVVVNIMGVTAVSASCATLDCVAIHN